MDVEARILASSQDILREDDSLLRSIFFKVLQRHHPQLANRVDVIYGLSKSWCDDGASKDFEMLARVIAELEPAECVMVCPMGQQCRIGALALGGERLFAHIESAQSHRRGGWSAV